MDLIKVITGIRRCGKSVILIQIMNELKNKGIKDDKKYYLFFDEIQNVATRLNEKIYVQVAYILSDEKVCEREFGV